MKAFIISIAALLLLCSCSLSGYETQAAAARSVTPSPLWCYESQDSESAYSGGMIVQSIHWASVTGNTNRVTAYVDADEVVIGGGFAIGTRGIDLDSSGLLTGSYPAFRNKSDGTIEVVGWTVESKDHTDSPTTHNTYAFAIGMKLRNIGGDTEYMSKDDVQPYVQYVSAESNVGIRATAYVDCPDDWAIIGGGAQILPWLAYKDNYITSCFAVPAHYSGVYDHGGYWQASMKSCARYSVARIRGWAVLLKCSIDNRSIPGFGDIRVKCLGLPNLISTGTYKDMVATTEGKFGAFSTPIQGKANGTECPASWCSGWVLSGMGILAQYTGTNYKTDGRFVYGMYPLPPYGRTIVFNDKDHIYKDYGNLAGQIFIIQYDYNSDN